MVRIGTWNLENLLQPNQDAGPPTREAYEDKLASLATAITALAPDVLAVQEVGDEQALTEMGQRVG